MKEATEKEFTSDGFFRSHTGLPLFLSARTGDNAQMGGSSEELQTLQERSWRGSYGLCRIQPQHPTKIK